MIDLGKIWLERSQREQNLIMLTMISICLALLILLSSSILSQTNQSRNQLKKAKQDFEYVKNGADQTIVVVDPHTTHHVTDLGHN